MPGSEALGFGLTVVASLAQFGCQRPEAGEIVQAEPTLSRADTAQAHAIRGNCRVPHSDAGCLARVPTHIHRSSPSIAAGTRCARKANITVDRQA